MARIEDGGKANAPLQGTHHDPVHFVVRDVADMAEIDRINDFVVAVVFVSVEIFGLTTMALDPLSLASCRNMAGALRGEYSPE